MPETLPTVNLAAALVIMAVIMAILASWIVVILRLAFRLPLLPPATPVRVPWGPGSVVLVVVTWIGLQIAVPVAYLTLIRPGLPHVAGAPTELGPAEQMTLSAVSNAFVLALVPLLLRLTSGARARDFGIVAPGFLERVRLGIVAYPLLAPVVFAVMLASLAFWKKIPHPLENAIRNDHSPGMLLVMVLAGVFFAPVVEELIFRGVLLGWLTKLILGPPTTELVDDSFAGVIDETVPQPALTSPGFADGLDQDPRNPYAPPASALAEQPAIAIKATPTAQAIRLVVANIAVSVVFGGLHYAAWPTPIPIFFLSLGLGLLYQRTGSLWPPIALHMTFNGVSTLLMILSLGSAAKEDPKPPARPPIEVKPVIAIVPLTFDAFAKQSH